jgi:hypothetical protein
MGIGVAGLALAAIASATLCPSGNLGFALLARVQHDRGQVRSHFFKSCPLVLAMTIPIPITICAWEFAPDLVSVLLGSQRRETAPIPRLTILKTQHTAAAQDPA